MNNKGMTTIEACVIIPISLTIICMLIWMGIFIYDKNALSQAASRAAIIGSQNSYLDNEEICDIVMKAVRELTEDKLVLMSDPAVNVTVGFNEIEVNVTGSLILPESFFFGKIYNKRLWHIDITEKTARLKPSLFVRSVSRIYNGIIYTQ